MSTPSSNDRDAAPPAVGAAGGCSSTYIAFVEITQEWAELPADGPDAAYWGAAMTHEMSVGMWAGCHVRILQPESALFPVILGTRGPSALWRERTTELAARARELRAAALRAHRVRALGSQPRLEKLEREPLAPPDPGDEPT